MGMPLLSAEFQGFLGSSSMIRKMFETGLELKRKYGKDKVYDFSLGNPDLPPPSEVKAALTEFALGADRPFSLGYMPNGGTAGARCSMAELVSKEQGIEVPASNVIATCGAAGGLNVLLRAVMTSGEEVICPSPYFVEYGFYVSNYGGRLVPVAMKPDFSLDVEAMGKAITVKTRAVIICSPNNPTGKIYSRQELEALCAILNNKSNEFGRPIYLILDEPYRFLNYDGAEIPSGFKLYDYSVVVGSFSKTLSLAGARIGYLAVSPKLEGAAELVNGLTIANRILGFVNAPVVAQFVLERCAQCAVDLDIYRRRRNAMAKVLDEAGVSYEMPRGAFYFFPKSPVADERIFVEALLQQRILAVAGRGFGLPGYIRLAFCVDEKIIADSAPGFKAVMESFR